MFRYRTSNKSTVFVHTQTTAYIDAPHQKRQIKKINATWIIILIRAMLLNHSYGQSNNNYESEQI